MLDIVKFSFYLLRKFPMDAVSSTISAELSTTKLYKIAKLRPNFIFTKNWTLKTHNLPQIGLILNFLF